MSDTKEVIHLLRPKEKNTGIKDSFSYKHGLAPFPYHTDTAFWPLPTRYFVLASVKESKCITFLIDFTDLINSASQTEVNILYKSIFVIKTPFEVRFTSLLSKINNNFILKYDPNIMFPYNNYSKKAIIILNDFVDNYNPTEIQWTGNNVAVIDNWRMLHARGQCNDEQERILKRIYIK